MAVYRGWVGLGDPGRSRGGGREPCLLRCVTSRGRQEKRPDGEEKKSLAVGVGDGKTTRFASWGHVQTAVRQCFIVDDSQVLLLVVVAGRASGDARAARTLGLSSLPC